MTPPDVSHEGQTLHIADRSVDFPHPIRETAVFEDLVVALFEPPSGVEVRDNVVAYDADGEHVWTIEPVTTEETRGSQVWVSLQDRDGRLFVANWNDSVYRVDLETGEISHHFGRWSG